MLARFDFISCPNVLAKQLEYYLDAHPDETRQLLGLSVGMPLAVKVDSMESSVELQPGVNMATLRIGERDAQRVMAYTRSCNWANGIVLVPTLVRLVFAGAFRGLKAGTVRAMRSIVLIRQPHPTRNLGVMWGALNLLSLAGWLNIKGSDGDAEFTLTPAGEFVVSCVERARPLFLLLANATSTLQHLHALCRQTRVDAAESVLYAQLARICTAGWTLPTPANNVEWQAGEQLRMAMDGLLLGPTWVALDMPVFTQDPDGRYCQTARSILDTLDRQPYGVAVGTWSDADPVILRAAWSLMRKFGMVDIEQEKVRLTEAGRIHRPIAAPYAGLPASYLRSYAMLDEILFGNPDPLDIDNDGHIDRVMNVYASSGAGSGPASQEITMKILRKLFDETPLELQPAGIADMGCGDGSALKRLAEYVIGSTQRGRHLVEYPLLVIGADYSEFARCRSRATLGSLNRVLGVRVRVIAADISQPDRYEEAVLASGLTVRRSDGSFRPAQLSDLLHTFMFLIHNRRLCVREEKVAEAILERHLRTVDRFHLRVVSERYYSDCLTVTNEAELPMTVDQLKRMFRVAYSDSEGLVPGFVVAADLIQFISRWKRHAKHGFLVVEGHSPWASNLCEDPPNAANRWRRTEQLPSVFNWGMHFVSRQFMMPFNEFMLAMTLAGLCPSTPIYGRIHPEGFPGLDLLSDYRFFSIANYVSAETGRSEV
ncbi:class I SAM-dependent methyltransferase [Burkholderia pyrrocinia]|uniref:class I SAM-dependent methyltransferase n=1 Tax=Burkholderia pyrrocinia TaxID=60550 RepID=UPI00104BE974|nr:class I SAM-dependent methyltransferase [Burkholderia pyrrocinia]TDA48985.1 class I SAM-dependent methyltransferase [Burkholderia pyrrocinia]